MKFEVRDGTRTMFQTEDIGFVPDLEYLESMHEIGLKFYIDNKLASVASVDAIRNKEVDTQNKMTSKSDKPISLFDIKSTRMVHCIETDQYFNKQSEAAKTLGIDPAAVSDSLKTHRKRSGFTFEWVER